MDALRPLWDAERLGLHSHAERGNDDPRTFRAQKNRIAAVFLCLREAA